MSSSGTSKIGNLLVLQAGGPTAVVNVTLAAIINAARDCRRFRGLFGVRHGVEGLIQDDLVPLESLSAKRILSLRSQPGAALGSSRRSIHERDLDGIIKILSQRDATAVLMIGGNGTMLAARQLDAVLMAAGVPTRVVAVPKTIDNDIPGTDRCPGYASAARFMAQSVRDVVEDVRTLPVPVSIFETMGRDTGWLVAATSMARSPACPGPQLILLPEHPFEMDAFLGRVDHAMRRYGWVVAAVSEGIRKADGTPVFETDLGAQEDAVGRPIPGDVGAYLAREVGRRLGLRCRSEKPGLCGRTSIPLVAPVDAADAEAVGQAAVEAVLAGNVGSMITLCCFRRESNAIETSSMPLREIPPGRRALPLAWLDQEGEPSQTFLDYLEPRIGIPLAQYEGL